MFRLDLGSTGRYCDGISRRSFLQLGVAGMASVGLPQLLRAKEESPGPNKNTSVILIWLDGGPGHMDMYDMKPDAPVEIRGEFKPISTSIPGIQVFPVTPPALPGGGQFPVEFILASTAETGQILDFARQLQLKAMKSGMFAFPPLIVARSSRPWCSSVSFL